MSLIENSLIDRHSIENLTRTVSRRGLLKAGLAAPKGHQVGQRRRTPRRLDVSK